jgi:hypothetical protein
MRSLASLTSIWPHASEAEAAPDERRVREYVEAPGGVSESAMSLSDKLGVSARRCRLILDEMVEKGVLKRTEFKDIEPIYSRFPTRGTMVDG